MDENERGHSEERARARLELLFEGFDRLTPDELARVGMRRDHGEARTSLLRVVAEAAEKHGRTGLLEEARTQAREAVLNRYSAGSLHPTFIGLNWGLSQGTVDDRVSVVQALEDAASAAVVADLVDRDVVDALSVDAEHLVDLSAGDVSDGSLAHVIAPPALGLRDTGSRKAAVGFGALVVGVVAISGSLLAAGGGVALDVSIATGFAVGAVAAGIVFALARRDRA
jgi:hypothetical protein